MKRWKISWFDGFNIRITYVFCDIYNVVNCASSEGVLTYNIFLIEQMPQE